MQKKLLVALLALFVYMPLYANAGPIVRTGEMVSVDVGQTLKGDFYGFGSDISISGTAENDAYLFGASVTVNAPITEDLAVLGGAVQVHGAVGDDVRVIGGEVTIADPVQGDVVVLGGTLTILSTATIEGDVLFYGESLKVDGDVMGSVFGAANAIRINSAVHGDVSLRAYDLLALGDNARIDGDVSYTSTHDLKRAQGAEVQGQIHQIKDQEISDTELWKAALMQLFIFGFAVCLLYVLVPKRVQSIVSNTTHHFGMYGLVGLSFFLLIPVLSILLFVSVIGFLFGIALLLAYLAVLFVAILLVPVLLGSFLWRMFGMGPRVSFGSIALGLGASYILMLVPFVGGLVLLAFFAISCGKLAYAMYDVLRR